MKNFETTRSWHFPGRNSLKLSYCSEDKLFKLHFLNKCILDGVFVLFCFKKTFRPKKEKKKRLLTYKHSSSRCAVYTVAVYICVSTYQSGFVFSNVHADINKPWGVSFRYSSNGIDFSCGWQEDISEADGRNNNGNQWQSKFKTIYNSIRSTDRFSEE